MSSKGVEAVTALNDVGSAELIGWGGVGTSPTSAAMLNSSFIQGFALDDYHPLAPLHSNALIVPAILAAASRVRNVSGSRFLLGAILGYETGPRVGQALRGLETLSRGWHSGVVSGTHSAGVSAGALYGLEAPARRDRPPQAVAVAAVTGNREQRTTVVPPRGASLRPDPPA